MRASTGEARSAHQNEKSPKGEERFSCGLGWTGEASRVAHLTTALNGKTPPPEWERAFLSGLGWTAKQPSQTQPLVVVSGGIEFLPQLSDKQPNKIKVRI
jgi:hypothetical protein